MGYEGMPPDPSGDPGYSFGETLNVTAPAVGSGIGSFLGPIGTIAGGALGSLVSGLFGKKQASNANAFTERMADKQMAFQERMSNSAYQRQMADMRAAGVNPMLAVMKGGGASSPAGAGGSGAMSNADVGGPIGQALGNSAKMAALDLPYMKSQLALNTAQKVKAQDDASLSRAMADFQSYQKMEIDQRNAESRAREEQTRVMIPYLQREVDARIDVAESQRRVNNATAKNLASEGEKKSLYGKAYGLGNKLWDYLGQDFVTAPHEVEDRGAGSIPFGGKHSAKAVDDTDLGPFFQDEGR